MTDPAPITRHSPHCPGCIPLGPYQEGEYRYDLSLHPWHGYFENGMPKLSDFFIAADGQAYPNITLRGLAERSDRDSRVKFQEAAHRAYIKGLLPLGYPKVWESQQ